jgi:predicted phosphodiesterase
MGVDIPDGFRARLVEVRHDPAAWTRQAQGDDAVTVPIVRCRWVIEPSIRSIDVEDLLKNAKKKTRESPAGGPGLFVFAAGDLQLGKPDGDGTEGTVGRFYGSLERAADRYRKLRKAGKAGPVLLAWAGDCIEGVNSQGGNLIGRLDLTLTEQIRVYRRLLLDQVQAFSDMTDELSVIVVGGNHDEALRVGNQMASRYDDSWAVEGAAQVADVMAAAGREVTWFLPGRDQLHLCVDLEGTRIGILHGHQTKNKMAGWLANKALARDPIGQADIVISGHYHHLRIEQFAEVTWMQTGSLDGGSVWWSHKGNNDAPPAAITFVTAGRRWQDFAIV